MNYICFTLVCDNCICAVLVYLCAVTEYIAAYKFQYLSTLSSPKKSFESKETHYTCKMIGPWKVETGYLKIRTEVLTNNDRNKGPVCQIKLKRKRKFAPAVGLTEFRILAILITIIKTMFASQTWNSLNILILKRVRKKEIAKMQLLLLAPLPLITKTQTFISKCK